MKGTYCVALLLAACAGAPTLSWTPEDVVNRSLRLNDPAIVEQFTFKPDGSVTATLGRVEGPLTGPVLAWKIVDGRLEIHDDQYQEKLELLARSNSSFAVRRQNGQSATYEVR